MTAFNTSRKRNSRRRAPYRLRLEPLENRLLLATFTVNSLGDEPDCNPGDGVCETSFSGGVATLRAAIQEANFHANSPLGTPDEIRFNILSPGVHTISPATALPPITDAVIINGYSQPAHGGLVASANTSAIGNNAVLLIELSGAHAGTVDGLTIRAGDSTVQGLVINGFQRASQGGGGRAIVIEGGGHNVIEGNFIGTDPTGTIVVSNGETGVLIINSSDNRIGGSATTARNVISGNASSDVRIEGFFGSATNNVVQGNYIGTNRDGTAALAVASASAVGVAIELATNDPIHHQATSNTIGGIDPGAGNVISGHSQEGILLGSNGNTVQGNFIGLDAGGTSAISNGTGIYVINTFGNTIGRGDPNTPGDVVAARNIISGNDRGAGVQLAYGSTVTQPNFVRGNLIGTDVTGTRAIGNRFGVQIGDGSAPNELGGFAPGAGNVISGNVEHGVVLGGNSRTKVRGNLIGTQADGVRPLGNGSDGINSTSLNNTIGGAGPGDGNVIAFNGGTGVEVTSCCGGSVGLGNAILGNSIHSNHRLGIDLGSDGVTENDLGDGDGGPNERQNFPEIAGAAFGAGLLTVAYAVPSTNDDSAYPLRIEFFAADSAGQEGETFLGFEMIEAGAAGRNRTFSFVTSDIAAEGQLVATATDDNGNTSEFSASLAVTVLNANEAPTAVLSAAPNRLSPGMSVQFSAAGSFDPDAPQQTIASYRWDFGDGSSVLTTHSPQASHVYQTGGIYLAMLTVVDSAGAASLPAAAPLAVNSPPVASLTAAPLTGPVGFNAAFDASASSDADVGDRIVEYLWDFGDGTHASTANPRTNHAYASRGRYQATVSVVDALSAQSPPAGVEIAAGTPPTAHISTSGSTSPNIFNGSGSIPFSAAASSLGSPSSPIVKYFWTRGSTTRETTVPQFTSTFDTVGEFEVVLVVEDSDGLRSAPASITIRPRGNLRVRLFEDLNGNGVEDGNEHPLSPNFTGYSLLVDSDQNGTDFGMSGVVNRILGPGDHTIQIHLPPHVISTASFGVTGQVNLTGSRLRDLTVGVFRLGRVTPEVFEDVQLLDGQMNSFEGRSQPSFWDQDNDGQFDEGEPSGYAFADLPLGTQHFRLVPSPGLVPVGSGGNSVVVTTSGFVSTHTQLGYVRLGSISGFVFTDMNGNGTKEGTSDPVLPGLELFLDSNHDGVRDPTEPTTFSNSVTGAYAFTQLVRPRITAANAPVVRPLALSPSQQVSNPGGGVTALLSSGGSLTNQNLGVITLGSVQGILFEDVNGSDHYEPSVDQLLANRAVSIFKDLNNDSRISAGEQVLATRTTDSHGHYEFVGIVPAGVWKVTQVLPAGWIASTPPLNVYAITVTSGSTFVSKDFGSYRPASVSGFVFEDLAADGQPTGNDPRLATWKVFLDLDRSGGPSGTEPQRTTPSAGTFAFADLKPGTYRVRETVQTGWVAGNPTAGFRDITLASGQAVTDALFANYRPASITGTVFDDFDGEGDLDSGDLRLVNRAVFLDTDNSSSLGLLELRVTTDHKGNYTLPNLKPGTYHVRTVPAAGEIFTAPAEGVHTVTVVSNQTVADRRFGVFELGVIRVSVVEDRNGDGSLANDNTRLGNRRVFLDTNHNGQLDGGEPRHTTASNGAAEGINTFTGLTAGLYDVRIEPLAGWLVTTPLLRTVQINSGTVGSAPFGNFQLGSISGRVLEYTLHLPANDGKLSQSHEGLPGRVVFLDANDNGRLDSGESSATTDDDGDYQLTGVGPGLQHVHNVLPPGWTAVPADAELDITISSGVAYESASYSGNGGSYFLNKRIGAVTGRVVQSGSSESPVGMAGAVVYFDLDNDGVWDPDESFAVTDDRGNFAVTRPINDGRTGKEQLFNLRLQIPLGFELSSGASFRVVAVPVSGLNVLDFEASPFVLAPRRPFASFTDTFDRPDSSLLGDNWREMSGQLKIAGNRLVGDATANLALFNSLPVTDVVLTASVGMPGFSKDVGLIARYQEATGDRYVGLLVKKPNNQIFAEIQLIQDGQTIVLSSRLATDTQGTLRFKAVGRLLTLEMDGHLIASALDATLAGPGLVGIDLGAGSALDDFTAVNLGSESHE